MKVAIVAASGGTNVGASFRRAATDLEIDVIWFDAGTAWSGNRLMRSFFWHFADRRPVRANRVSLEVLTNCERTQPDVLVATGAAPLFRSTLRTLRSMGVVCMNYSTDDPWNPAMKADWYLLALPEYSIIFSTRRANIKDFQLLGCREVRYLPFGYDQRLFYSPQGTVAPSICDILFVGGGDRDRVGFMTQFMQSGLSIALVGDYWERFPATRRYALGHKSPEIINALTAAAKVNLCLVRRANRDGHVMRSFEIAAIGGCMLAEDTTEHREIFGGDGECVVYFRTPDEAAERARTLLVNAGERRRLALAAQARIVNGAHTYQDRLLAMLRAVPNLHHDLS